MKKMVDGVLYDMTPEEIAEFEAGRPTPEQIQVDIIKAELAELDGRLPRYMEEVIDNGVTVSKYLQGVYDRKKELRTELQELQA